MVLAVRTDFLFALFEPCADATLTEKLLTVITFAGVKDNFMADHTK
jgi:hypothetical protein